MWTRYRTPDEHAEWKARSADLTRRLEEAIGRKARAAEERRGAGESSA
jgi:hypothetical protein